MNSKTRTTTSGLGAAHGATVLLLGSLCAAGCSSSAPENSTSKPAKEVPAATEVPLAGEVPAAKDLGTPQKTKPVMSSYSLKATLTPQKDPILLGEAVYLRYKLKNLGDSAIQFREGGNQRNRLGRYDDYQLRVQEASGHELPVMDSEPNFGGKSWAPKVASQESFVHQLFLPHWAAIEKPGNYRIRSERVFTLRASGDDAWFGESGDEVRVSAEATIVVLPADAKALGVIIAELGQEMLSNPESEERRFAGEKMAAMDDARVVPWYCKAIATKRYTLVSSALSALRKFPTDDEALAGILFAVQLGGSDLVGDFANAELAEASAANLRVQAAQTLAESSHPDAYAQLLKLTGDSYEGVRLTVLHGIANKHKSDAKERITAFTKDTNELVRQEAQRYLNEL